MADPGVLAPLRHPAFRRLAAARITSMLGNAVAPIALAFAVLDLTGSVAALGLVVGVRSLANVVFLLFGGVVADRLPRQLVLVGSSLLAGVTQAVVATLVLTGTATVPVLTVLGIVNGTAAAFALPASSALVPQTVPPAIRQQANAILRLGINGSSILGASLGGALVAVVGAGWGLAADAVSFGLSAAWFAAVRVPVARVAGTARRSTLAELAEGWQEFRARTWVWVVVLAFLFVNAAVIAGVQVLGPAVADATFGRAGWGVVLASETVGMLLGGLLALRLRVRRLLRLGMVCVLGESLLVLGLALTPYVPVLVALGLLQGLTIEQFGIAWETSLQQHVPADRLARVYSYDALGSFIAIPLGEMAVGPVARVAGTVPTLLGCAAIIVVATLLALLSRDVRDLETVPEPEPAATPTPEVAPT